MNSADAIHLITEALGKEACQALVVYLDDYKNDKLEGMRREWLSEFSLVRKETAEGQAELKVEMERFRAEVAREFAKLRQEFLEFRHEVNTDIANLRNDMAMQFSDVHRLMDVRTAELRSEIHKTSRDQIKWFFASNAALAGLIIAGLKLF